MLNDDLRCTWYIMLKDLRAYYFKPPNISWGIIFPFAFILSFIIREPGNLERLVPGMLGLTLLFGASSMEAIVITFERRIGALERLLLAPVRLPALLAGKVLGGIVFALVTTFVVLLPTVLFFHLRGINWLLLSLSAILAAATFSSMGALISAAVNEVFEAQTLANAFRFPMMFLGGVFVPVASLPPGLRIVARALPLTYVIEALDVAIIDGRLTTAVDDLGILAAFTAVFFGLAAWVLKRRLA
jgi:ABC-2 type transport system permease protein